MGDIRTFSDALPVLAALNMTPEPAGRRLWRVGIHTLDKGGVIRMARELAARQQEKPMTTDQGITVVEAEVVDAPLTTTEQQELEHHEKTIEHGLQTYIQVGHALAAIRDGRLYRATHREFDVYVRERWAHILGGRRQADRLIAAAEVAANLGPIGLIPANESQARVLAPLPSEDQRRAMQAAVDASPGGKPTAAQIQKAVDDIQPPAPKGAAARPSGGGGGAAARPAPAATPARARDGDAESGEIATAAPPLPPMLPIGQPASQPAGLPPMLSIGRAPASPDRQALMQAIACSALLEAAIAKARQKLEQLAAGQSLPATVIDAALLEDNAGKLLASPEFRLRSGLLAMNMKEEASA